MILGGNLKKEYLLDKCLDGEQSAELNGTPMQQAYLWLDKTTSSWMPFPSGMTLVHLTEQDGEELLMSFLEAFPVKTCPLQSKEEMGLMEKEVDSGERWGGLLARLDPDTSVWRTPQCSLIMDSIECLEIFPNWGLMQNGVLWEQTPLVRPTEGKDFGWLPTPVASDYMTGKLNGIEFRNKRFIRTSLTSGTEFGAKLADAFRLMTTKALPPNFSEWMMGLPIGWTDLKGAEMDKSQNVQHLHGTS